MDKKAIRSRLVAMSLVAGVQLETTTVVYAQSHTYTFLSLASLGGDSTASGVNDAGQVAGTSSGAVVLWNSAVPMVLSSSNGSPTATGINNSGQVVGSDGNNAILWNGTLQAVLRNPNTAGYTRATAINAAGLIAGYVAYGNFTATVWDGSAVTTLQPAGGADYSYAYAINNLGTVAGLSKYPNALATIWSNAVPRILPPLDPQYPDNETSANGINDSGQVVGFGYGIGPGADQLPSDVAVLWNTTSAVWRGSPNTIGTSPVLLQSLVVGSANGFSGTAAANALAINNSGQIVGYSCLSSSVATECGTDLHAVLWDNSTTPVDLNSYLTPSEVQSGIVLLSATAISSNGTIAGNYFNTLTNTYGAFELLSDSTGADVPIPTWALCLLAASLYGIAARRRI
jgi:uncharacterized membrane protein